MITEKEFGTLPDGEKVQLFSLENRNGVIVKIITYGGAITEVHVPDRDGKFDDVVLGFDNLESYLHKDNPYFGCITGRVAGRLTSGKFTLDGESYSLAINDAPNHLHGGINALNRKNWNAEIDGETLRLSYLSPHDECGYPGNLGVTVSYALSDDNALKIHYSARTDKATPLSLTNHSYFNLAGEGSGDVADHVLQIHAEECVPTDAEMTLTDKIESVEGTPNDFRTAARLGDQRDDLLNQHGVNYIIPGGGQGELVPVANVVDPNSGRKLETLSNDGHLQFYTGVSLDGSMVGKSGKAYEQFGALCLECQGYPNGVNAPHVDNNVLHPGDLYDRTTVYKFSTEA